MATVIPFPGKFGLREISKKKDFLEIYELYISKETRIKETRMRLYRTYNEKCCNKAFIPYTSDLNITSRDANGSILIKPSLNVKIATTLCHNSNKNSINPLANDYLLCHLFNLMEQIKEYGPTLYMPENLEGLRNEEMFRFEKYSKRISLVRGEFDRNGFWGNSYIIIGEDLGEF